MYYERNIFRYIYNRYKYVSYVFCMGKSDNITINNRVYHEIKKYNDIIQFYYLASYFSLILQTYNFLLWSSRINIKYKWLIKHDSDTFFNIKIIEELQRNIDKSKQKCIFGYVLKYFPSGMGYIIPYEAINKLLKSSSYYLNRDCYGNPEDVFIGNLAKKANISMYDVREFNKTVGEGSLYLDNIDNIIMIHRLKPNEIFFLHSLYFKNKKILC